MQDIEAKITSYLIEKYNPTAIVLHGSRANGMARERSDWDLVIFTDEDMKPVTREIVFGVNGANIEIKQIILPSPEDKLIGSFLRKDNIKILFDPQGIAETIISQNDRILKKGNLFTEIDRLKRRAFLLSALDGIADYSDTPLIIFDKKIDFYTRAIEAWFRFLKNEFEISHYYAFPRIQKEDPEFYIFVVSFVDAKDASELVLIGKKIIKHLFPDLE